MALQDNQTVAGFLKDLGYDVPSGNIDAAALAPILSQAITELKSYLDISSSETDITALRGALDTKIQETRNDSGFQGIANTFSISEGAGQIAANALIESMDIQIPDQLRDNMGGVIKFVQNYETFAAAAQTVQQEASPTPAPTSTQNLASAPQGAPVTTPADPSKTVTQQETEAAAKLDPQIIRDFQTLMQEQYPNANITVNGQWDGATKHAYLTYGATLTGKPMHEINAGDIAGTIIARYQSLGDPANPNSTLNVTRMHLQDATHRLKNPSDGDDIATLQAEKAAIERALQQTETVVDRLHRFGTIANNGLQDVFAAAHENITPPTGADVTEATTNPLAHLSEEEQGLAIASGIIIEQFLSNESLHAKAQEYAKALDPNSTWTLTKPENADGYLDEGSQASLQQVLGILVSDPVLGLRDYQTETGAVPYTPQLGQSILSALNRAQSGPAKDMRDMLDAQVPEMNDPLNPGVKKTGASALIAHMDYLYRQDIIKKQRMDHLTIPQMNAMQAGILTFIVGFINQMFPNLLPAVDGMCRQFTGSGLLQLAPALGAIDGVREKLGGMDNLDPHEQLVESFKRSFRDSESAEDRSAMEDTLMRAASTMSNLPFGSDERRKNYPAAVRAALDDAMAIMGDAHPDDADFAARLDQASQKYATTFIDEMKDLNAEHGGPDFQDNPTLQVYPFDILQENLTNAGFDIDGNAHISPDEIDRIAQTYNSVNYGVLDYNHTPLLFTDNNGNTFIAGIDKASNMFTVEPLPCNEIDTAIARGDSIDAIKSAYPGYALAEDNYRPYFNMNGMRFGGATYDLAITQVARDPEIIKPFDRLENLAHHHLDREQRNDRLEAAFTDPAERKRLAKSLSREIMSRAGYQRGASERSARTIDGKEAPTPEMEELMRLRDIMNSPSQAQNEFANAPRTWANAGGEIYVFSRVDPQYGLKLGKFTYETNVTEEIARYKSLPQADLEAYRANPDMMARHFNNLTSVAQQYPQFNNAFDLARNITHEYKLRTDHVPHVERMPQWLERTIASPAEKQALGVAVRGSIKLFKPDNGHIYIVGKGDNVKDFIGYDIAQELQKFTSLTPEQRDVIFQNPQQAFHQFPRMTEIADQYPQFDANSLATSLLQKESVRSELNIAPIERRTPEAELDAATAP